MSIQERSFIAPFQERVRSAYPLMKPEVLKTFTVDERGSTLAATDERIWRFLDPTQSWRLSLQPGFLALETRQYVSRVDFISRLNEVLVALVDTIKPTHVTRIGVRYVDRVEINEMSDMEEMLRPEMMGIGGNPISDHIAHAITEVQCRTLEGQLLARWGLLPPQGSHDPEVMPPVNSKSWFLDLDTFVEYQPSPHAFNPAEIRYNAANLAARAYSFFRWSVTEKFLKEFGASPQ
jgi:uncharacterized protein (TIGR04255 family)